MRYWLVMPAAGAGRRFGSPKQYAALAGSTVLETAMQLFLAHPACLGGSLVLAEDDPHREGLSARLRPRFQVPIGGADRVHSVRNGLAALAGQAQAEDWVLVHDAARPCLSAADLQRLLELGDGEPVGALLAVPVADTVKSAGESVPPRVDATLARESLWLAQTPQMFRYGPLCEALERAIAQRRTPTDEAQAMEWQGFSARLVPAQDGNLKVTCAADLVLAAAILAGRRIAPCA